MRPSCLTRPNRIHLPSRGPVNFYLFHWPKIDWFISKRQTKKRRRQRSNKGVVQAKRHEILFLLFEISSSCWSPPSSVDDVQVCWRGFYISFFFLSSPSIFFFFFDFILQTSWRASVSYCQTRPGSLTLWPSLIKRQPGYSRRMNRQPSM